MSEFKGGLVDLVAALKAENKALKEAAQAVVDEIGSMECANQSIRNLAAALTKEEEDDEPDEDYPPCKYCGEPQCDCDTL